MTHASVRLLTLVESPYVALQKKTGDRERIGHRFLEFKTKEFPMLLSLLSRFFAAMIASRQRQAEAELKRHGVLLPFELERAGWKINERNEDSLPFAR
jgi:hypothetical protein